MNTNKEIIVKELKIWKSAYPEQSELLEKFANKIRLELELKDNHIAKIFFKRKVEKARARKKQLEYLRKMREAKNKKVKKALNRLRR